MKKRLIALAAAAVLIMTSAGGVLAQETEEGAFPENSGDAVVICESEEPDETDDLAWQVQESAADDVEVPETEEDTDALILEIEEILPAEAEEPEELPETFEEVVEISLEESGSAEYSTLPRLRLFANTQYTTSYGAQLTGAARTLYNEMEEKYAALEKTYADPDAAYTGAEGQTLPSFSYAFEETYSCHLTAEEYKDQTLRQQNADYVEMTAQLKYAMQAAYDAYIFDHPEAYWLGTPTISFKASAKGTAETGYEYTILSPAEIKTHENYSGFLTALTVYQENVAQAVSEIQAGLGTGASRYDTVKAIHDYLCERLSYDNNYKSYTSATLAYKKVHSVAGVFVYDDHKVVCDGYARSFKVLCDQFGIECVVVPGKANEAHAWNYVKMDDGNYYLVDVTWDDSNSNRYAYFLIGSTTVPITGGLSIAESRTVYTRFSEAAYTMDFAVPTLSNEELYGHQWTEYEFYENATCTADATRKSNCIRCNAIDIENIPDTALGGHEFGEYVPNEDATCTTQGTMTAECARGDATDTIIDKDSSALGHSFTNYVSDGNATCTADGTKTAVCDRCDETDTVIDSGSALGHSFTNYISDGNATCTTEGTMTAVCDRCGRAHNTISDPGSTLDHNWEKGALVSEATVFVPAYRQYRCTNTNCGLTENRAEGSTLPPTIQLNVSSLTLQKTQSTTAVQVSGLAKGDYIVSWSSGNTGIATVNSKGKITAKNKTGSTKVTVTLASGLTGVIKVKVQSGVVKTTKISGVSKKLTLKKGQKLTLTPVLTPITSGQKLTYTSTNKKVVTVSSRGVLQAKKAGKATIRVSSGSRTVKCTVTVK